MPVSIHIQNAGDGIRLIGQGCVTGAEVLDAREAIYGTALLNSLRYEVVDFTEIDSVDLSADDIQILVKQDARAFESNAELVVAIACEGDLAFGLARMWQILTKRPEDSFRVFRSREMAEHRPPHQRVRRPGRSGVHSGNEHSCVCP